MWKKYSKARQAKNDSIIWCTKDPICVPDNEGKSTDAQSYHVIFIAFPRQQWLRQWATMLRSTYIVWLLIVRTFIGRFLRALHTNKFSENIFNTSSTGNSK